MPRLDIGPVELEAVSHGNPCAPAILLIQGLGTPLTRWPEGMIQQLADEGYCAIAFDNRDSGLSTQMDTLGMPDIRSLMGVQSFTWTLPPLLPVLPVPYTLADMATDAVMLLDALQVKTAHIVGASLGGMIAQLVAAHYPERCLSLTSIMSSSSNPFLPPPTAAALHSLFAPLPVARDEDALIEDCIWRQKVLMRPGYPSSDEQLRAMFASEFHRHGFHPQGVIRQLATLLTAGDRRPLLMNIDIPATVMHGADDPLINVACGRDTAACIPGAELRVIEGMGHDFPAALAGEFACAILAAARRAENGKSNA